MEIKMFEVRDRATFIPVMAIKPNPRCEAERALLARGGFGRDAEAQQRYTIVVKMNDSMGATYDPYAWVKCGRTMNHAHRHIEANWDKLASGDVVDVEFILGETAAPKESEASHAGA